jgi:glycosyltransferase involved in cell wall biosynthesis
MNAPLSTDVTHSKTTRPIPRVAVVQDGARLHYAIPLALQNAGLLERMFTEWFVTRGSLEEFSAKLLLRLRPALGRKMLGRQNRLLNAALVRRNPALTVRLELGRSRRKDAQDFFEWASEEVARWVEKEGPGRANTLFGYIRNIHPELCAAWRERGALVIADQIIAPAAIEAAEARRQAERFPGWETGDAIPQSARISAFEERTWKQLHHLTCASDYVKRGLIAQGVAADRITVLPYPIEATQFPWIDRTSRSNSPLTVGCIGTANLRKGLPYFLEVARRFDPARVRFVWVGPIAVDPTVLATHRGAVEFPGPQPRDQIAQRLADFDLFLFPSTCEGSAGAVTEAMSTGLPVVTTPNAGSIVRHGTEGFIHDYDDIDGLAASVERLLDEPDLRAEMGRAAATRAGHFDIDYYSREIAALLGQLLPPLLANPAATHYR